MSKTKTRSIIWDNFVDFGLYCVEKYKSVLNFPMIKRNKGVVPRREKDTRKTQRAMSRNRPVGHADNKDSFVDMTDIH